MTVSLQSGRRSLQGLAVAIAAAALWSGASGPAFAMPFGGDAAAKLQLPIAVPETVPSAAPAAAQEISSLAREVEALRARLAELERRLEARTATRTSN